MGDALDDKSAGKPRPPKRRRWLSYSLRGLFLLVFVAALPTWWIRSELDGFAAEHEAIVRLRSLWAAVYTRPAEPRWLWGRFPGATKWPPAAPKLAWPLKERAAASRSPPTHTWNTR